MLDYHVTFAEGPSTQGLCDSWNKQSVASSSSSAPSSLSPPSPLSPSPVAAASKKNCWKLRQ